MSINRHNYEEFFILYLDNELSSEDRRQVELFVQNHPDLGEELQLLEQTRFELDPTVVFEAKESLMKPVGLGWINADNQEEWLVQYIDNELINEQKAAVEIYVANNPSVKAELELLQRTKSRPEASITFPNKESLYRKEEAPVRFIVPVRLWRVAAAVLLLIALTIGGIAIFKNNRTPDKGLATTGSAPKTSAPVIAKEKKNPVDQSQSSVVKINNDQSKEEQIGKKDINETAVAIKNNNATKTIRKSVEEVASNNPSTFTTRDFNGDNKSDINVARLMSDASLNIKKGNNLPDASRNPNMTGSPKEDVALANVTALTNLKENTSHPLVTSGSPQSFIQAKNTLTTDEDVAVNEPEKKTKFRGLLRKLTRTFEKTTNIKATDDDDRLLVAGLAFRL